jgi:hypothetical protein
VTPVAARIALRAALALLGAFGAASAARAYEPDPVSDRLGDIADSTEALNREVNRRLAAIVANWRGPRDDRHLVYQVWDQLSGIYWVHHIEAYANRSPEVERLPTRRYHSIYTGMPFWATRVIFLFGVCPTVKLNGAFVGTDKLGHFFAQGKKYYLRWLKYHDEARAAEQSAYTERAIFGSKTTGVYSNGDLVSNYEGYRFYRALFEDGVIRGKPAMLHWDGARWELQQAFDWRDYVNPYWDEGIDISRYDHLLYPHMRERMLGHCGDYARAPERFGLSPERDAEYQQRYAAIQLLDTNELRLDHLCANGGAAGTVTAH